MIKKFFVKTLGCKVNQVESAFIIESLKREGFEFVSEDFAQIFILNSCIVTARAQSECKKILKKWHKKNPELIFLTGCYAQRFPEEAIFWAKNQNISKLILLGQQEKLNISDILKTILEKSDSLRTPVLMVGNLSGVKKFRSFFLHEFFGHSRAFVKIQDGCDNYCSYCIVPYCRGAPRSAPLDVVLKQVEIFVNQGYKEIVLTGIHIGKWGKDLDPPARLVDLLIELEKFLSSLGKHFILRLSSLEVNEIDQDFLDFAKNSKFLAPHFHIPLQSGSNKVLKFMNRHYTREFYLDILNKLYKIFPHATFGADVIVGFPGEEEKDFEDTYQLIEESPLNWLHIFPFSSRPGTKAENLPDKVHSEEIKKRCQILKSLILKKREKFLKKELGTIRKVVLEKFDPQREMYKGLSENYIGVFFKLQKSDINLKGKIFKVVFKEKEGNHLIGEVLSNPQNTKE